MMVRIIAAVMSLGIVLGLGFALVSGTNAVAPVHVASAGASNSPSEAE